MSQEKAVSEKEGVKAGSVKKEGGGSGAGCSKERKSKKADGYKSRGAHKAGR